MRISENQLNMLGAGGKKDGMEQKLFNNYVYANFSLSLLDNKAELLYKGNKICDIDIDLTKSYSKTINKVSDVLTYVAYYQYIREQLNKLDILGYENLPDELQAKYSQFVETEGKMHNEIKNGCKNTDVFKIDLECYAISQKSLLASIKDNITDTYYKLSGVKLKSSTTKLNKVKKSKKQSICLFDRDL